MGIPNKSHSICLLVLFALSLSAPCQQIIVDDMIDTGSRITKVAELLQQSGASSVYAFCTHGLFSGDALAKVSESPLKEVVVTNTIPVKDVRHVARSCIHINRMISYFESIIRRSSLHSSSLLPNISSSHTLRFMLIFMIFFLLNSITRKCATCRFPVCSPSAFVAFTRTSP
jgi:hypothetical protein